MGAALAERGLRLVYGGGGVGLMGALADAVLEGGGEVVGLIPEALLKREVAHEGLSELHVVGSMHERKKLMADLSDAFIALPGGYGTLEELAEVISWAQLGIHKKPCALLDVDGYWKPLATLFDRAVEEGFIPSHQRHLVLEEEDPEKLLSVLERHRLPETEDWLRGPQEL
jgi:uncharacterized protein (TIGR00730 family)